MEKAKLFMNGGSQAVRLPKGYRFEGDEVMIKKIGRTVMLYPVRDPLDGMLEALEGFSDDFLKGKIEDLTPEERDY